MDDQDAFDMGAKPGDRVRLFSLSPNDKLIEPGLIAIVDIATDSKEIDRKIVGLYDEILETLNINDSTQEIEIFLSSRPKSYDYIRKKVKGQKLSTQEIIQIVQDCNEERLLASELASFITAVEIHGMSDDEIVDFTIAYAKSGDVLDFGSECYDKHSTGGVPGNKVTLIIVPIAAAAGIFIPKTSTRAITSPSGTADSFEVFGKIAFSKEELMKILNKTNAGIFWTGSFNSAPAADV
ncbi:MAG: AMP phosphorylase, partial [Promethearchaeota archaeon]